MDPIPPTNALATPLDRLVPTVVQASLRLDEEAMQASLDQAWANFSPDEVIEEMLIPCAYQIAALGAQKKGSLASEHLMLSEFTRRVNDVMENDIRPLDAAHPILMSCLPNENHEFGSLVMLYSLGRRGLPTVNLGSTMPLSDLEQSIRLLEPRCVLISIGREELLRMHLPRILEVVRRWKDRTHFLLSGVDPSQADFESQGLQIWPGGGLEALAQHLQTLHWR